MVIIGCAISVGDRILPPLLLTTPAVMGIQLTVGHPLLVKEIIYSNSDWRESGFTYLSKHRSGMNQTGLMRRWPEPIISLFDNLSQHDDEI